MAREKTFNIAKVAEDAEQTLRPATTFSKAEPQQAAALPYPTPAEEIPTKFRGRKKVVRTIEKVNGKTLYFDDTTNKQLREVAWNTQVDMQDIIRVAVNEFIDTFSKDNTLTDEGRSKILDYVKKTSKIID